MAANVYTEMNAISKGVSLGIFESSKNKGMEATKGGSQPYVDIMGRRSVFLTNSSKYILNPTLDGMIALIECKSNSLEIPVLAVQHILLLQCTIPNADGPMARPR